MDSTQSRRPPTTVIANSWGSSVVMRPAGLSRIRVILALVGGVSLAAACGTSDGPQTVFSRERGVTASGPTHVDEINDESVPGLHNLSDHPVRLRSVKVVDAPRSLHLLNVHAYSIKHVGYGGVVGQTGDLPSECPGQFVPHPISSFVVPAHRDAGYFVVIAFTFSEPGRYHIRRIKIYYTTDGKDGWQYQNLNRMYAVSNPPLPGLRPEPKSAVCGKP
jgi:hypothetical protein